MRREFESNMYGKVGVTVSEGSELWTQVLHDAETKQNEAFRKFHDWFYGLMDPVEEKYYTDAVVITMKSLQSNERN